MKMRDQHHHSAKNVDVKTIAEAGTYYPNLNLAETFRWDCSGYATVIGTPKNPRDNQRIRLELVSANATTLNFSTAFHVNGAAIADGTHANNDLLILEGNYNATTAKWNVEVVSVKAA